MANLADLPLKHRLFLWAYKFRRLDPVPWARIEKPLSACRVVLVTTAAFHLPEQEPFDEAAAGGDPTYRVIPTSGRSLSELRVGHRSSAFDPSGIALDFNLALPVDRFRELEEEGRIGALHSEALSFMGGITAPGRLARETAPEAARRLKSQAVEAAFLCPV